MQNAPASPRTTDIAAGFAMQSQSDFEVYDLLRREVALPKCHRLHYLQMASEKACKAYLYSLQRGRFEHLSEHNVVEKVLSLVAREPRRSLSGALKKQIRKYAREIDRLAPAVDRVARPDNTEYPWVAPNGNVLVPVLYEFPEFAEQNRQFISTLKILREIAHEMSSAKTSAI